jgi:hypothetical protein
MENDAEAEDTDDHEAKAVTVSKKVGRNYKKLSISDAKFADRVALLLKYSMEFGSPKPIQSLLTSHQTKYN